ncbi:hypothetical protein E2C01_065133 [Portunus trituberculatus]|uniref:Uncharacterized protein n=1 Tax=Portunus trituberculatus TaxID=210409 RepID=A0A5B7HI21_PORTR|nr:hypothetical protein [Portunus trituberculatus]
MSGNSQNEDELRWPTEHRDHRSGHRPTLGGGGGGRGATQRTFLANENHSLGAPWQRPDRTPWLPTARVLQRDSQPS